MTATWPRQRPAAAARAVIKTVPEDFQVVELADPSVVAADALSSGEHLYLLLEKISLTTTELAAWLAESYGVAVSAVGYAGMKDKQAVTEQWFSVQTPLGEDALPDRHGVRLCAASRQARKLRRGQLAGNRFRIRLRDVAGDGWCERLATIRERGVPNYFGPQRFGTDNIALARAWLQRRPRRRVRNFRSGLHLSVLRSLLFNEVLGLRVGNGCWDALVAGDVPVRLPSAGPPVDERLVPTGPLWGRGRSAATDAALEMEQTALARYADVRDGLEHAGLVHERRSLVLKPEALLWQAAGTDLELQFALPPGAYATSLLAEAFDLVPGARP